jgi:hypothetical protein
VGGRRGKLAGHPVDIGIYDMVLNPYDAVPPQRIPQTGWDAILYHALLVSHGRQWLVGAILAVSLAWCAWVYYQVRRDPAAKVNFLRRLIITNVGFVVIAHLGSIVVAFLPLQIAPPPGYGFAMKWLIPYGMALVGWGFLLVRLRQGQGGTAHS